MMRNNLAAAGSLILLLFATLGVAALSAGRGQQVPAVPSIQASPDSLLADRVETMLRSDFGLAGSRLRIFARAGVVTLSGTVPDQHSLERALNLAGNVNGVGEVLNALEIELP